MKWVKEKKPTSYYLKGTRNFEKKSLNRSKRLILKHLDKADVDYWSCSIIQKPIPVKHQVVQSSRVLRREA